MKYLVTVRAESVILVDAEDEDHAQEIAFTECSLNDFSVEETTRCEKVETEEEFERALRHCSQVI